MFFKKQIAAILTLALIFTAAPVTRSMADTNETDNSESIKVLFVGNSLTYYNEMPTIFEGISNANEVNVEVDSVTSGSYYLSYFAKETNRSQSRNQRFKLCRC